MLTSDTRRSRFRFKSNLMAEESPHYTSIYCHGPVNINSGTQSNVVTGTDGNVLIDIGGHAIFGRTTPATNFCQDEQVQGAALGTAFNALYDVVKQKSQFKSLIKDVEARLRDLEPLMNEITPDAMLGGVATIKTEMEDGKKLIEDYKPRNWLFKKTGFSDKLRSLDKSLSDLLPILSSHLANYQTKLMERLRDPLLEQLCEQKILIKITGLQCPLPKPPSFTVGLEKPLGKLRKFIVEPEQSMLVITAPAGCGKTTLATVFCHDQEVQEKFKKNIFFVDVSEKPNLDYIVEQVFLHKGYLYRLPPTIANERCRESFLEDVLREEQQPVLLVLDGVWCGGEYDKLLEKFNQLELSTLKILVTSRFHFPRFDSSYDLNWLEDEYAEKLFDPSPGDGSSRIPEHISKEILKNCKGLPLAITRVRDKLCGKATEVWKDVLGKDSILEYENDVHRILESSLKALDAENNDNLKNCFLDLASFPEDRLIPAAALIDMWSHSYDLHDNSDIDNTCIANLHQLKERTLADLVFPCKDEYTHGYFSEHFVNQHEMLRELAIHQTRLGPIEKRKRLIMNICGNHFPKWLKQQECRQPMKARLLSISTDRAFSTNWQLPDLEVIVLNLQTNKFQLPEFMKELVDKLKVLIVTYYGFLTTTAELSNLQLLSSLSNLKRIRLERISVPSIVDENLIKLESVEKISLFMCDISRAFSDNSINFFEAFPRLEEMNIDYCNGMEQVPTNLCHHTLLKRLSITNCHELRALPEEIEKLENLEQLRLVSCTNLSVLPGSITNLRSLNLLDISYCSSMTMLPYGISGMPTLTELIRRRCDKLQSVIPSSDQLSVFS